MAWIVGIVGAFLGLALALVDESVLGFFAGFCLLWLIVRLVDAQRRIAALEHLLKFQAYEQELRKPATPAPATEMRPATVPGTPATAPAPAATPSTVSPAAAAAPASPAPMPAEPAAAPAMPGPAVPAASAGPAPPSTPRPPPIPPRAARPTAAASRPAESRHYAPAAPSAFDNLLATAKGWLFEGNIPVKIGLLVLLFGVGAAIKYAADVGWLVVPIELRLAGIAAAAVGALLWGLREAKPRPAFGLSLQGGAVAILLLTTFGAYRLWHVIPAGMALGMVVVLVAGTCVLAIRQNAQALAWIALLGGYLAPVLISTGSGNHIALFTYYAVLNAAVFLIAWLRPWRALNLLGFVFTFGIGTLWGFRYYRPELFGTVEPFLVGFFLMYVSIPVLYALQDRAPSAKVDATLLFGTPLLAFPLQVALLEAERMPLALSALAVAAIYLGLALWSRRHERLRVLAATTAIMGLAFATLAVPLALSARWTSASWALQGAALVWLGLRQQRRIPQVFGLGLQLLAALAYAVSLPDSTPQDPLAFLNGHTLNVLLLAAGAMICSRLYEREAGTPPVVSQLLFGLGLLWWGWLGLREAYANVDIAGWGGDMAAYTGLSMLLALALDHALRWPRMRVVHWLGAFVGLLFAITAISQDRHWLAGAGLACWLLYALGLGLGLRRLQALQSPGLASAHIAALVGLALQLCMFGYYGIADFDPLIGSGWRWVATWLPLTALVALAWKRPRLAAWPVDEAAFAGYRSAWLALAGSVLGLSWALSLAGDAASDPLPWLPLLNPQELWEWALLLAGSAAAARALGNDPQSARLLKTGLAFAGIGLLSIGALRACHHVALLPWSPRLLFERVPQVALTVTWTVTGMAAWIAGSKRLNRPLWMLGAFLLGIVLLKLLIIDRQYLGNITGIVSFVVVGVLLVVVGYLAPTPPSDPESKP
jgi:uncharacterized membrane protein